MFYPVLSHPPSGRDRWRHGDVRQETSAVLLGGRDWPAYRSSAGLGSKLSTWLNPPQRKIQITALAFAGDGGTWVSASIPPARTTPSRASIVPSVSPVKPMPVSARNDRRVCQRRLGVMGVLRSGRGRPGFPAYSVPVGSDGTSGRKAGPPNSRSFRAAATLYCVDV